MQQEKIEILKLISALAEVKYTSDELNYLYLNWQKKESANLKIDWYRLCCLKKKEKKKNKNEPPPTSGKCGIPIKCINIHVMETIEN